MKAALLRGDFLQESAAPLWRCCVAQLVFLPASGDTFEECGKMAETNAHEDACLGRQNSGGGERRRRRSDQKKIVDGFSQTTSCHVHCEDAEIMLRVLWKHLIDRTL